MTTQVLTQRAFGVVRVSRARDDARSPGDQRKRIEAACAGADLQLTDVAEELDVSGGATLAKRPGLLRAVEAVEAGEVEVVVVAYFDRLVRSLQVQAEVVDRIETAGGRVLTVDVGEVSNGTASKWLSSTFLGAVNEYHRRATAERTVDSKRDAVARGVAPFPRLPPGIRRRAEDRVLEQDPRTAPIVRDAFELRAGGASLSEVRDHLNTHGIKISHRSVHIMLGSRLYLGELRFGKFVNERALPAIVPADVWRRVQSTRASGGRKGKSERLLARLGILRCSGCGSRMVVHVRDAYRCPGRKDECAQPVVISARIAEGEVERATRELLAAAHGEASIAEQVIAAEAALERAEAERDSQVAALAGIAGDAVRAKLLELQATVDEAADQVAELRAAAGPTLTVSVDDWDKFTLDERRRLIRLAIDRALVAPANGLTGADRVTIVAREPLG
jgi:DNA invertase Pin-like site-specific DNA recombinase